MIRPKLSLLAGVLLLAVSTGACRLVETGGPATNPAPAPPVEEPASDEQSPAPQAPDNNTQAEDTAPPTQTSPHNYEGIPDPSKALGFDVWKDYPVDKRVKGERGRERLSCKGTADKPCLIDASSAEFVQLALSGEYAILQGGLVFAESDRGPWFYSDCHKCVIRDLIVVGTKTDNGHSSAIRMNNFNVWIRGKVRGFGDNRPNAREQDYHGMKIMRNDVWVLDAEIYDVSGDSIQVGDASRGAPERVYIGGGHFYNNRENAVDIKDSRDVVVSGVTMSGFKRTASSSGEALIVHDDAFDAVIVNNTIRDTGIGIVSSGKSGHRIENNTIEARAVGIQIRSTRNITVQGNDISAPRRVHVNGGGVSGSIQR